MSWPLDWIVPNWPAPAKVRALSTTRGCASNKSSLLVGQSKAPYHAFNLGDHVGDNPSTVLANRQQLAELAEITQPIVWLSQVHGVDVVNVRDITDYAIPQADAAFCQGAGPVCVVMTADCLPVLFCDKAGTQVAAAHAGWRGLADGVLEATVATFAKPSDIMAWLGPAIGPSQFEVGAEVREAFLQQHPQAQCCFVPSKGEGKYLADIYQLARLRLQHIGVSNIYGGEYCTVSQPECFYSYRRDGVTGRQASLIWLESA